MKQSWLPLLFLSFSLISSGQSSEIGSNAIVEYKYAEFTITSVDKVKYSFNTRVTILNPNGEKYGNIEIPFDNHTSITDFHGAVYGPDGKRVQKLSLSGFYTVSDFSEYSLFTDDKEKRTEVHYFNYPYTVEYEYKIESDNFMGYYFPLTDNYNILTKTAALKIKVPNDIIIFWKSNKFEGSFDTSAEDNFKTYSWKAENIGPVMVEKFSPGPMELFPSVIVSPSRFKYDKYSGSNDSWENYGKWVWSLLESRNELPPETAAKVHQLADPIRDTLEKIKRIYTWFQSETRYVSISKGIGGYQPFPASTVDKCKYGDCKALCNYLKSLLAMIGIEAIYTEIGNGDERTIKWADLPGVNQTNHIILTIPLKKDTLWLECTSQEIPFGFIGSSNSDRKALCITRDGGKLVNTPIYKQDENYQYLNALITVQKEGNMECRVRYSNGGILMNQLIELSGLDRKHQQQVITEMYPMVNAEIADFSIKKTDDLFPGMSLNVSMNEKKFLSRTGNLFAFKPDYLHHSGNPLTSMDDRRNDIWFSYGYITTDTIKFILPDKFRPEDLPDDKNIESPFGTYHSAIICKQNEMTYIRTCRFNKGWFPKKQYNALKNFISEITSADNEVVIFRED